jgi:hypothetical protein
MFRSSRALASHFPLLSQVRLDIDRWADRTIDKALFEGHYYADKLPGLSLLAVPVVAAAGHVSEALGRHLNASADEDFMIFAKN